MVVHNIRLMMVGFVVLVLSWSTCWAIPVEGQKLLVTGPSSYANEAGLEIGRRGGNVVDVAVGVALALAVTTPYYAAFGGGGFALVEMGKGVEAIDFREMAPIATHEKFFADKDTNASITGGAAIAVPGIPAGLWALHQKYGKLHWSQLFTKPIKLATEGFLVTAEWSRLTKDQESRFNLGGKGTFFKKDGKPYLPGDLIKQEGLGKLLREMRNRGQVAFYQGVVAEDMIKSAKASGGVLNLKDFKEYKVRWLKPLKTQFFEHDVFLMPPPSSGGVVIQNVLHLLTDLKVKDTTPFSVEEFHLIGEALNRGFRGRTLLGDPDFHKNPLAFLTSEKYLKRLAKTIDSDEAEDMSAIESVEKEESLETTHFSVMDAKGNTVAMTLTLNGSYGSGVVSEKYGIALNNQMDDFTTRPNQPNQFGLIQGDANAIQPGKRPLSSMSPTIVKKGEQTIMSLGAPGGPRIISAVAQVLYRTMVRGLDMDRAIQAPRVHDQFLPRELTIESNLNHETQIGLTKKGHKLNTSTVGKVFGLRKRSDGILEGAYDSRGEGATSGY